MKFKKLRRVRDLSDTNSAEDEKDAGIRRSTRRKRAVNYKDQIDEPEDSIPATKTRRSVRKRKVLNYKEKDDDESSEVESPDENDDHEVESSGEDELEEVPLPKTRKRTKNKSKDPPSGTKTPKTIQTPGQTSLFDYLDRYKSQGEKKTPTDNGASSRPAKSSLASLRFAPGKHTSKKAKKKMDESENEIEDESASQDESEADGEEDEERITRRSGRLRSKNRPSYKESEEQFEGSEEEIEESEDESEESDDEEAPRRSKKTRPKRRTRRRTVQSRKTRSESTASPKKQRPQPSRTSRRSTKTVSYTEKDENDEDFLKQLENSDQEDEDSDDEEEIGEETVKVEKVLGTKKDENVRMVYVKWKERSYLHCSWIPEEELLSGEQKRLYQNFLKREEAGITGLSEDGSYFDPEYCNVERVIARREIENDADESDKKDRHETDEEKESGISPSDLKDYEYLVKWKNLQHCDCTWERAGDLKGQLNTIVTFLELENGETQRSKGFKKGARIATREGRPKRFQEFTESPTFKGERKLRDYQLEGLNWLAFSWHNCRNSILADEMGLGKTVQSVSLLNYLYKDKGILGPFLVVAPLSTIGHWQREFEGWTEMRTIVYYGNAESREIMQNYEWDDGTEKECGHRFRRNKMHSQTQSYKFQVLITTYETLISDSSELCKINWRCLIVDEAHRLKNNNSRLFKDLCEFEKDHVVLLTGTPIQNRSRELGSLLHFLEPTEFESVDAFEEEFGNMKSEDEVKKLQKKLKPYLLRRVKGDVLKALPPRVETLIEVELTSIQKRWYRSIYERNTDYLMGSGRTAKVNLDNIGMQLRKCCNHPYLLEGCEEEQNLDSSSDPNVVMERLIMASGKTVLLNKLLPKLKKDGHRVLIFSQMVRVLDILEDFMNHLGYGYERLDGGVKGSERQAAIDRYSKDDSSFAFLLSTRAGGVGINLTAADTVIIFDSDWNPQNDVQAQARCHRIGQKKKVQVYRLVTRNTYEQELFTRASQKLGLDRAVLGSMTATIGKKSSAKDSMKKEEIEALLKHGAYHVFLSKDDDTGKKFCEESIDSILAKHSREIKFDDEKGEESGDALSAFSKASFVPTSDGPQIDVNDPEFWQKLGVKKQLKKDEYLNKKRSRKQTRQFGKSVKESDLNNILSSASEDEDEAEPEYDAGEDEKKMNPDAFKLWSQEQRNAFYSGFLEYGFWRWKKIRNADPCLSSKTDDEMIHYAMSILKIIQDKLSAGGWKWVKKYSLYDRIKFHAERLWVLRNTTEVKVGSESKDPKIASKVSANVGFDSAAKSEGIADSNSVTVSGPKTASNSKTGITMLESTGMVVNKVADANEVKKEKDSPPEWLVQINQMLERLGIDQSLKTQQFLSSIKKRPRKAYDSLAKMHDVNLVQLTKKDDDWQFFRLPEMKIKEWKTGPSWWNHSCDEALISGIFNLGFSNQTFNSLHEHEKLPFKKLIEDEAVENKSASQMDVVPSDESSEKCVGITLAKDNLTTELGAPKKKNSPKSESSVKDELQKEIQSSNIESKLPQIPSEVKSLEKVGDVNLMEKASMKAKSWPRAADLLRRWKQVTGHIGTMIKKLNKRKPKTSSKTQKRKRAPKKEKKLVTQGQTMKQSNSTHKKVSDGLKKKSECLDEKPSVSAPFILKGLQNTSGKPSRPAPFTFAEKGSRKESSSSSSALKMKNSNQKLSESAFAKMKTNTSRKPNSHLIDISGPEEKSSNAPFQKMEVNKIPSSSQGDCKKIPLQKAKRRRSSLEGPLVPSGQLSEKESSSKKKQKSSKKKRKYGNILSFFSPKSKA